VEESEDAKKSWNRDSKRKEEGEQKMKNSARNEENLQQTVDCTKKKRLATKEDCCLWEPN
jgi:hypothetical protein